jgi:hypothetical protein
MVIMTGINHLDPRHLFLDQFAELEDDTKRGLLLSVASSPYRPRIFATVSRIEDDDV